MLIEQHQLIKHYGAQRQQLRPLQAFDGPFHPPLKDVLEQAIEPFNGLRPQFVEHLAHFHAAIAVGIRPVARGDHPPAPPVVGGAQ
jgi:hypothetical protein